MKYVFMIVSVLVLSVSGCGTAVLEENLNPRGVSNILPPGGSVLECIPGDCNQSGDIDAGDATCITLCLIGTPPAGADCTCAADCDCSGEVGANDPTCATLRLTDQFSPDTCAPSCGDGFCEEGVEDENSCAIDCGCSAVDACVENAPIGCYCDELCVRFGDCCPDACDACGSCE